MADLNDDIARYLSGRMSPAEMHALEKRALDDPFIADALDGGGSIPEATFSDDVSQLQQLISERTRVRPTGALLEGGTPGNGKQVSMWSWPTRIAAGLLLVASAGVVLFFISDNQHDQLALNTPSKKEAPGPTLRKPETDSISARVRGSADAAGDANIESGQSSAVESQQEAKPLTSAPADEQARREQNKTTPSVNGDASPKSDISAGAGNRANNDSNKDKTDKNTAVSPLDGYVAGAQKYAAKPKAETSAESPAEIESVTEKPETELSEIVTTKDAAPDAAKARSEIAAARQESEKVTDDPKSASVAGAVAKKERKANPAPAIATDETTEAKQVLSAKPVFSGRVVDADGTGIPGVNVVIKGTNTGTVTDIQGNYQLSVSDAKPTLVFTFIGYASLEQEADASTPATVALEEDLTQLSEVVVAGYGTQRTDEPNPTFDFANPAGGRRAFKQYLEKNLQYPREALLNNVEGRVTIQFSVSTTGSLSDFKVLKGLGNGCDQEVIRLIKSGPKWNPTKRDDVAEKSTIKVRMRFQLPREKKR